MAHIYVYWPEYPHIYAVCEVYRHIMRINLSSEYGAIIQLDYSA